MHNVFYDGWNYCNEYLNCAKLIMTKKYLKSLNLFFFSSLLLGCGQMGPLYLPKDNVDIASQQSTGSEMPTAVSKTTDTVSNQDQPTKTSSTQGDISSDMSKTGQDSAQDD